MNNVNMANMPMVPGPPVGPAMPMMANGGVAPAAGPRPQQINEAHKHLLNTYIYEYFLRNEMFDCARALLSSDPQIKVQDPPNARRDENGNVIGNGVGESMDVDSKDNIDTKGSEGLPQPSIPNPSMDNPFLYEWFCLFWDMFNAQKGKSGNVQVNSYMNHTQVRVANHYGCDHSGRALTRHVEPVPSSAEPAARDVTQHAPGHVPAAAAAASDDAHAAERRHEYGNEAAQQHRSESHGQ